MANDLLDKIGQHHLCLAAELKHGKRHDDILQDVSILYRWWFPKTSPIMTYLNRYVHENPNDYQMRYLLEHGLQAMEIGNSTYYALYFGKSTEGRTRFKKHINGPIKNSTIRKTIRAILHLLKDKDYNKKERISSVLTPCYFEWMEFLNEDAKLIDSFEIMAITVGHYPLNLEDNSSVSKEWIETISDAH